MSAGNPLHQFLLDEDQPARLEELKAYIGPNAEKFLPTYEGMRAKLLMAQGAPKTKVKRGFVAAAFFLGPVWFFYRKMWVLAIVLLALMVLIGFIPVHSTSRLGLPFGILLAFFGQSLYLDHAIKRIMKLRQENPGIDLAQLSKAGGVSKIAGYTAGAIAVAITILAIIGIVIAGPNGLQN